MTDPVAQNESLDWLIGRTITAVDYLPGSGCAELVLDDGQSVEFEVWWDWSLDKGGMTVVRWVEETP